MKKENGRRDIDEADKQRMKENGKRVKLHL